MSLSKIEQETIIFFNQAEQEATVYTHNKALKNRLDGLCASDARFYLIKTEEQAKAYKVPKKSIRVRKLPIISDVTALKKANIALQNFHQKENPHTAPDQRKSV